MHLAEDYEEGGIVVDYSKSVVQVAMDVAVYHVRKQRDVQFLKNAHLENPDGSRRRLTGLSGEMTTWLPGEWCGYKRLEALYGPKNKSARTKCSADAISVEGRRLRLRGLRLDRVNTCLTSTFDTSRPTAKDLWESPLGSHLHRYTSAGKQRLPEEVLAILVGNEELRDLLLGGVMSDQTSQKSRIFMGGIAERAHKSRDRIDPVLYKATASALEVLLQIFGDPQRKHQTLYTGSKHNLQLFKDVDKITMLVLRHMFRYLHRSMVIMTESRNLGRITDCDLKLGDEIWVVLGCDYPLIFRRLLNGRYLHISAAEIPAIQEREVHRILSKVLSSDIQSGDQIGEWVVEDIELE
jgi:hypothetical protein